MLEILDPTTGNFQSYGGPNVNPAARFQDLDQRSETSIVMFNNCQLKNVALGLLKSNNLGFDSLKELSPTCLDHRCDWAKILMCQQCKASKLLFELG
jgi:hypothetical protein